MIHGFLGQIAYYSNDFVKLEHHINTSYELLSMFISLTIEFHVYIIYWLNNFSVLLSICKSEEEIAKVIELFILALK